MKAALHAERSTWQNADETGPVAEATPKDRALRSVLFARDRSRSNGRATASFFFRRDRSRFQRVFSRRDLFRARHFLSHGIDPIRKAHPGFSNFDHSLLAQRRGTEPRRCAPTSRSPRRPSWQSCWASASRPAKQTHNQSYEATHRRLRKHRLRLTPCCFQYHRLESGQHFSKRHLCVYPEVVLKVFCNGPIYRGSKRNIRVHLREAGHVDLFPTGDAVQRGARRLRVQPHRQPEGAAEKGSRAQRKRLSQGKSLEIQYKVPVRCFMRFHTCVFILPHLFGSRLEELNCQPTQPSRMDLSTNYFFHEIRSAFVQLHCCRRIGCCEEAYI